MATAGTPQKIDRRYQILRRLGEGVTGEVYLVESADGRFALKLLKPLGDQKLEESVVSAFKFEFGFLKDLRHPNVVQIKDFGFDEDQKRFYFTEEFLEALSIDQYGKEKDPEVLKDLLVQSAHGLQAIHRAHILHGDLKGDNLLVVEESLGPRVKIIDMGLSDPRFPATAGTPSTMAPEKILNDPVDERADLYSLGVIFYSLFTGENPLVREGIQKTYEAHLTYQPPKITLKNPKVPSYWNEIFETLLAKNPAHRYRSCGDLLEAIELAQPGSTQQRLRKRPWQPERWVDRSKILDEATQKIRQALAQPGDIRKIFLITGEGGVGKSRLVQEIKYQFQMDKVKVFETKIGQGPLVPPEGESYRLWVLDHWSQLDPEQQKQIWDLFGKNKRPIPVVLSLLPEEAKKLTALLDKEKIESLQINIDPFSKEDLQDFLNKMTGLSEIPEGFLKGLWDKTHGNPKLVLGLLEQWVKQKKLVDAHGQWNLSIFKEGEIDFQSVALDLTQIDQALVSVPVEDHPTRADLWIQRGEELLKRNLIEEASESLKKAEDETSRIEDLSKKLQVRARIYEKEGFRQIRNGNYDEARVSLERALSLLEESRVEDLVLSIRIYNFIAWLHCQEGDLDRAIELFLKQQKRWKSLDPDDQAKILNNDLGFAYLLKEDFQQAILTLTDSLSFFEEIGDGPSQMKALYNLAEAYLQAKDYTQAIEKYLKASDLARFEKNYELLLRIFNGLGKTYHLKEALDQALSYYERALELARYLGDFSSAAAIAQNIGSIQSEHGEFEEAQSHFELALKMLKKIKQRSAHTRYLQCRALLEMGDVYRKRKLFEEALGYVREADQLALQEDSLASFRFWVLHTRCQIEKDQGRWDKLQESLAELLPLADDPEKKKSCLEFEREEPPAKAPKDAKMDQTRAEKIIPEVSGSEELQALIRVARWLASEKDPQNLLTLIIRQAAELSGAEAGLLLLEGEKGNLEPRASVNLNIDENLLLMSRNIAKQVLTTGQPALADNALEDGRYNIYQSVLDLKLRSILALPVLSQNRVLGVLALIHRYRDRAFQSSSLDLMKAFADQAGIALENANLISELETAKKNLINDLEFAHQELHEAKDNLAASSLYRRFAGMKLVSQNKAMGELFEMVERIRDTELSVVLYGESGTGKELIARSLHKNSRRAKSRFVAVNCAVLPANLIESELFGFRAGAFTGATRDKKGLIEEAQGGTLFLDEIAEMELPLQGKLLRVLQEKEITRLGDTQPTSVQFRLLSASHRNLKEEVSQGNFREDLYYRVCEIELALPPLRERKEDIPLLSEVFIQQYLEEHEEKAKVHLGRDLLKLLMDYDWPGNVRELENTIRVATALRKGSGLHVKDLPESLRTQLEKKDGRKSVAPAAPHGKNLGPETKNEYFSGSLFDPAKKWKEIEILLVGKALLEYDFDVQQAAKSLCCAASKIYQLKREFDGEVKRLELKKHPYTYAKGDSLEKLKREVFKQALEHAGDSPYQAARMLAVSPGMVYKWTSDKT